MRYKVGERLSKKGKFNNNRFGKMLYNRRKEQKLSQVALAEDVGVSPSVISRIERGEVSPMTGVGEKLLHSGIFDEQWVDEECGRRERARKVLADKQRIRNIPGFYKKLNGLTRCGRDLVDVPYNHPELMELQRSLGVPESTIGTLNLEIATQEERIAFANELRSIRGNMTQTAFAKKLGIEEGGYRPIEYHSIGSSSTIMQNIVSHDYFTGEQEERLREAYEALRGREQALRLNKVSHI